MSFDPLIESRSDGSGASTTLTASRQKRQLVDQAIDAARAADWTRRGRHQRARPRLRSRQRGREPPRQGVLGAG